MIRVLLTHGGRSVIQAFLQAPQELATVLQTMASVHGFEESSMILLLTRGSTLAVQAVLETPEKIAAVIEVLGKHNLVDPGMIMVLLTHGGRPAVRALLETPEKITVTKTVFSEIELADSSIISQKLFGLISRGRVLIVDILLESLGKLSNSIRVFSQNAITDPGVILMILEMAGDSVIHILIQEPQKLADIILSSTGMQNVQTWSSVFLMNETQVPTWDQQTHSRTYTHRPSHTRTHIFMFCLLLKLLCPTVL